MSPKVQLCLAIFACALVFSTYAKVPVAPSSGGVIINKCDALIDREFPEEIRCLDKPISDSAKGTGKETKEKSKPEKSNDLDDVDALTPRELDIFSLTLHQVMASHEKPAIQRTMAGNVKSLCHLLNNKREAVLNEFINAMLSKKNGNRILLKIVSLTLPIRSCCTISDYIVENLANRCATDRLPRPYCSVISKVCDKLKAGKIDKVRSIIRQYLRQRK